LSLSALWRDFALTLQPFTDVPSKIVTNPS
jgi:hypothetical protein